MTGERPASKLLPTQDNINIEIFERIKTFRALDHVATVSMKLSFSTCLSCFASVSPNPRDSVEKGKVQCGQKNLTVGDRFSSQSVTARNCNSAGCRDVSDGTVMAYGMDGRGSIPGRCKKSFSVPQCPLGPTQPHIQRVPALQTTGV